MHLWKLRRGRYRYQIFNTGDTKAGSKKIDTREKYRWFRYCTWPFHALPHEPVFFWSSPKAKNSVMCSASLSRTIIKLINWDLWLVYLCCWFNKKVLNNNHLLQCELTILVQPDHVTYQLTQWHHNIVRRKKSTSYSVSYRFETTVSAHPIPPVTQNLKQSRFTHVRFPALDVGHVLQLWPGPDARKQDGKRRELERSGEFKLWYYPGYEYTCHNSYRFKITTATAATQTMRTKKPTVKPAIKPVFDDGLAAKPRENDN